MVKDVEMGTWQRSLGVEPRAPGFCKLSDEMKVEAENIGMPAEWAPPLINGDWREKSFIGVEQLTEGDVAEIVNSAAMIANTAMEGPTRSHGMLARWLFPGIQMTTAFYETSTRTRDSFEIAMLRLGGQVVSNPDMMGMSSVVKGETVSDSAKVMACFFPLIVQRHPKVGAAAIAAYALQNFKRLDGSKAQIINAGDGIGEHPTQALLDVATVVWEKGLKNRGDLRKLTVGMVGDLKNGRTVHSLAKLLTLLGGPKKFVFISPEELAMPLDVIDHGQTNGQNIVQTEDLEGVLPDLDVLYVTRIQKERFLKPDDYERLKGKYVVSPELLRRGKEDLTIMHPLPRVDEIPPSLDNDPRAAYFRQVGYGLYVRMALLCQMVGKPYPHK